MIRNKLSYLYKIIRLYSFDVFVMEKMIFDLFVIVFNPKIYSFVK